VRRHDEPLAARTPASVPWLEDSGARCAAGAASAVGGEGPDAELIPVAADQVGIAGMAIGGLAGRVVDVAGIDVAKSRLCWAPSGLFPCLPSGSPGLPVPHDRPSKCLAPAVAVLRPEQRHLSHDFRPRYVGGELTMHGLGDDETEIVGEAVRQPLMPVRGGIGMTKYVFTHTSPLRTSTGHGGASSAHMSKVQ
jgi:hypothetical protein